MLIMTNTNSTVGCCALCQYWYGEAVEFYNSTTGAVIYNSQIEAACEYQKQRRGANHCCNGFVLEYIYLNH